MTILIEEWSNVMSCRRGDGSGECRGREDVGRQSPKVVDTNGMATTPRIYGPGFYT